MSPHSIVAVLATVVLRLRCPIQILRVNILSYEHKLTLLRHSAILLKLDICCTMVSLWTSE